MSMLQRSYDCFARFDPELAGRGYALAAAPLPIATLDGLRRESERLSRRSHPLDPLGKDGCGLLSVMTGLARHSEIVFDAIREPPLAAFVTALIGPGWVPFRSQLLLRSPVASLGQWHQDQQVFVDHFDDEIALTVAIPVDWPGSMLQFAAYQPDLGRLLAHSERVGATLAFAAKDPEGVSVTPPWRPGVPLAFHAYALHRWTPAAASAVYLFEYRSSYLRRHP